MTGEVSPSKVTEAEERNMEELPRGF